MKGKKAMMEDKKKLISFLGKKTNKKSKAQKNAEKKERKKR